MFRHVAIIVTTALLATACDEQSFDHADPSHPRPTVPDRAELDELADDEEDEETGDAGMDGVDPLPDVGVPEPAAEALCCVCSTMQCFAWEDGEAACETSFSEPAAWCELDVFGGATECAAACS